MEPIAQTIAIITSVLAASIIAVFAGAYIGLRANYSGASGTNRPAVRSVISTPHPSAASPSATPAPSPTASPAITSVIDNEIPFTPQAPLGQWSDPVFQDGCEEASILMAMHWVNAAPITSPEAATEAIRDISQHQIDTYGEYRDRSAADTLTLMREYFTYSGATIRHNIALQDIKNELALGNITIVPINGRTLPNHHYTPPGPERHMLVIRGYDPHTQEFITNDPGTKFGNGFRFNENDLFTAIRDYPTGYHEPIQSVDKNMIVVHPAS